MWQGANHNNSFEAPTVAADLLHGIELSVEKFEGPGSCKANTGPAIWENDQCFETILCDLAVSNGFKQARTS